MQSYITRSTILLSRVPRPFVLKRTYAQHAPETGSGQPPDSVSAGRSNRIPVIAAVSLAAAIPIFYFLQGTIGTGNKSPGSGQAEIKEARRKNGTQNEYRDPRDSGKKTTEADG